MKYLIFLLVFQVACDERYSAHLPDSCVKHKPDLPDPDTIYCGGAE